jgi:hypothetical protein
MDKYPGALAGAALFYVGGAWLGTGAKRKIEGGKIDLNPLSAQGYI